MAGVPGGVEAASQRFLTKAQAAGGRPDPHAALGRLAAIDALADVVAAEGSRPSCGRIAKPVLTACAGLLVHGVPFATAHAIRRLLTSVWGWLDAGVAVAGHQVLLDALASMPSGKDVASGRRAAAVAIAATAAYRLAGEVGMEGAQAARLVDALAEKLPSLDKLSEAAARVEVCDAVAAGVAACTAYTAPIPLHKDMKFARLASAAVKDKDPAVRAAGYRVLSAAAAGAYPAQSFGDHLIAACGKGVCEEKHAEPRTAAAEALATALHSQFVAAVATPMATATASDSSGLRRLFGGRSPKPTEALTPQEHLGSALAALRNAFGRQGPAAAEVREAIAYAARVFLVKCGSFAVATAPWVVSELVRFATATEFCAAVAAAAAAGSRSSSVAPATYKESELMHACRCASGAIVHWADGCGSDAARIVIIKQLLLYLHALTPRPAHPPEQAGDVPPPAPEPPVSPYAASGVYHEFAGVFEPASTIALWALPGIIRQLGAAGLEGCHGLRDLIVHALFASGTQCGTAQQRTDSALIMKMLTEVTPHHRLTDEHLLMSVLIHHSGNALCGVGTKCDHEAIRSMLTAGQALLGVFLPTALCPDPAIHRQLAEVSSVTLPEAPYDQFVESDPFLTAAAKKATAAAAGQLPPEDPKQPNPPQTPVDPQLRIELACLLDACTACCGGVSGVLKNLGLVTERLAPILHGQTWPEHPGAVLALLRARGNALLALLSVVKFVAAADTQEVPRLGKLVHPSYVEGLEDTFRLLYNTSMPPAASEHEVINVALCHVRALAFDCVAALPSARQASSVYALAVKAACSLLTSSHHMAGVTLISAAAPAAVPPHASFASSAVHRTFPARVRPLPPSGHSGAMASGAVSNWAEMIDAPGAGAGAVLIYEGTRTCPLAALYNAAVRCVGTVFALWGGLNNRKVVMEKLRDGVLECVDVERREKAVKKASTAQLDDARTAQLNMTAAALCALAKCSENSSGEAWAKDPVLCVVVQDALTLAKAGLGAACFWTRTAAAEIVGLAMGLAGPIRDPVDGYLPTVVMKALSCEAAGLAQSIGALHAHDPANRGDVAGLSLSYLAKVEQCDDATPSPYAAVAPHVLTSVARLLASLEAEREDHAAVDSAMLLVCHRMLQAAPGATADTVKQALQSGTGRELVELGVFPGAERYDVAVVTAGLHAAAALVAGAPCVGRNGGASTAALCLQALLREGEEHTAVEVRTAARRVVAALLEGRAASGWGEAVDGVDVAGWVRAAVDDLLNGRVLHGHDVAAAAALLRAAAVHAAGATGDVLSPKTILVLLDRHPGPTTRTAVEAAGAALAAHTGHLASVPREEVKQPLPLGCCRVFEWVDAVSSVLAPPLLSPEETVAAATAAAASPGVPARAAAVRMAAELVSALPAPAEWWTGAGGGGSLTKLLTHLLTLAEDNAPSPLRAEALRTLAALLRRFAHCSGEALAVRRSLLVTAAVTGLTTRTAPAAVVSAAAGLAAEMLCRAQLPLADAMGMFTRLASTYVEYGQDLCVQVDIAAALCQVLSTMKHAQARPANAEDAVQRQVAAAILKAAAGQGGAEGVDLNQRELDGRCLAHLNSYAVVCGLDAGWMVVDGSDARPLTRRMRDALEAGAPHFLSTASAGAVPPLVALGVVALLLQQASDAVVVVAALRSVPGVAASVGAGWDAGQRAVVQEMAAQIASDKTRDVDVRAHAVACQVALTASEAKVGGGPAVQNALGQLSGLAHAARMLLVGRHMSRSDAAAGMAALVAAGTEAVILAGAVAFDEDAAASAGACVASALLILKGGAADTDAQPRELMYTIASVCAVGGGALASRMATVLAAYLDALCGALTARDAAASPSLQLRYSTLATALYAAVVCRKAADVSGVASPLDAVRRALTHALEGGADGGALHALLGLRACFYELKRLGIVAAAAGGGVAASVKHAVKELSLLCVVVGGAASLPVGPGTPSGCTVKAVELCLDAVVSTHGVFSESEFRSSLSLTIATLSTAADAPANAQHAALLCRCLLQLAQRYPGAFRDLMPALDDRHVQTLRAQMARGQPPPKQLAVKAPPSRAAMRGGTDA